MSDQVPTPETQNPQGETADQGSLDAAALAFETREAEEPQADQPAEEPPKDDSEAEPDEGEPADDTEPEEALAEVDIDGLKLSVPADKAEAIQKALLRQADYSRKMNEVSAKEKVYTSRLELADKLVEGGEKFAEVLAEVKSIDAQIKRLEGVNWQQIRQDNPAEYAALATDLHTLRLNRQAAEQRAGSVQNEVLQAKAKLIAEAREEMDRTLQKNLKGWGDELGTALTKYAAENGINLKTLQELTDPGVVIALDKARRFDALQKSKETVKAKAKDAPPVVKPGAPRPAPNKSAEAMARLRKSNSVEDAAAAFLAR